MIDTSKKVKRLFLHSLQNARQHIVVLPRWENELELAAHYNKSQVALIEVYWKSRGFTQNELILLFAGYSESLFFPGLSLGEQAILIVRRSFFPAESILYVPKDRKGEVRVFNNDPSNKFDDGYIVIDGRPLKQDSFVVYYHCVEQLPTTN